VPLRQCASTGALLELRHLRAGDVAGDDRQIAVFEPLLLRLGLRLGGCQLPRLLMVGPVVDDHGEAGLAERGDVRLVDLPGDAQIGRDLRRLLHPMPPFGRHS
jgi:hypothetical protein